MQKEKQFVTRSMENFGVNLSRYLEKMNIKVNDLAFKLKVSPSTVYAWCKYGVSKDGRFPSNENLIALSIHLQKTIDSFLK